ncbi:MAG: GNAT family N-acetyltransferase [Candidatus Izemoplasmatales bacterium]
MEPILITERLILRKLDPSDKPLVFAYRKDPEVSQYQSFVPHTLSDMNSFFSMISELPNQIDSWFQLGIETKKRNLIGDIGIHTIDEETIEIGYTLSKSYQGQGFAYEALSGLLPFWTLRYHKNCVIAIVETPNIPSKKLLMKLGFELEKEFVEDHVPLQQFQKKF